MTAVPTVASSSGMHVEKPVARRVCAVNSTLKVTVSGAHPDPRPATENVAHVWYSLPPPDDVSVSVWSDGAAAADATVSVCGAVTSAEGGAMAGQPFRSFEQVWGWLVWSDGAAAADAMVSVGYTAARKGGGEQAHPKVSGSVLCVVRVWEGRGLTPQGAPKGAVHAHEGSTLSATGFWTKGQSAVRLAGWDRARRGGGHCTHSLARNGWCEWKV
eukprot:365357-Chlamydomonas_euryale.AAC.1